MGVGVGVGVQIKSNCQHSQIELQKLYFPLPWYIREIDLTINCLI